MRLRLKLLPFRHLLPLLLIKVVFLPLSLLFLLDLFWLLS